MVLSHEDIWSIAHNMNDSKHNALRPARETRKLGVGEKIIALCVNATHSKKRRYYGLPEYEKGMTSRRTTHYGAHIFSVPRGQTSFILVSTSPIEEKAIEYMDIDL